MQFSGLSSVVAKERLLQYGNNEIRELFKVSIFKIFLRQITSNFIIYLLFISMLLSFFVGKDITAYTIGLVILIVVGMGFIQEYRAEKAIKSLKTMIVSESVVIRDGKQIEILTSALVPGDIVLLRSGEKVPADCIIREINNLRVNESILTGESKEILKQAVFGNNHVDINRLFMGTLIVNGKAIVEVQHTGMNTEFGKIAGLISTAEKQLPLREKVNNIAKFMVFVAIIVSISTGALLLFGANEINAEVLVGILIVIVAVAVSAFPEGFPIVLTTTLALGAKRMAAKNAIVNRMSIIETLGETTVICSDKTGTITKGEMTAKKIITFDESIEVGGIGYEGHGELTKSGKEYKDYSVAVEKILKNCVICNDAVIERTGEDNLYDVIGTSTEGALLVLATKAGLFKADIKGERLEEIPFSSEEKVMAVLYKENDLSIVYEKGAPDVLIKKCNYLQKGKEVVLFTPDLKKKVETNQADLAKQGYRVLGFSYSVSKKLIPMEKNSELIFCGLVAMEDPPRAEVAKSIKDCLVAGIKVKMITGDYKETALAIAKQVGIIGDVLEGAELDELTDQELSEIVQGIAIFARVRPEHKLRIVKALKNKGEIVTMTGDGVNDAPALKEAHIGVAMGKNGTDVSRDSSDLILKDDNFSTIVLAIEEGRAIYTNVRKFVSYQLSCNIAELSIIFFGILLGYFFLGVPILPLVAIHILFMNLVTADLSGITLGVNPPSRDAMQATPRKNSALLDKESIFFMLVSGIIIGAGTLFIFWLSFIFFSPGNLAVAQTSALVTLIIFEIFNAFNFRSLRFGVHELPLNTNKYLIYASILSLILTLLIIYTPLNVMFETTPIKLSYWIIIAVISTSIFIIIDVIKKIRLTKKDALLLAQHY